MQEAGKKRERREYVKGKEIGERRQGSLREVN